ncbi:MAG: transposase [Sodalis sp. (in: enterobacteria)]
MHNYYDYRTQQHRKHILSQIIRRYISYILSKHFKIIRYYGFLSNRKYSALLSKIYDALRAEAKACKTRLCYAYEISY